MNKQIIQLRTNCYPGRMYVCKDIEMEIVGAGAPDVGVLRDESNQKHSSLRATRKHLTAVLQIAWSLRKLRRSQESCSLGSAHRLSPLQYGKRGGGLRPRSQFSSAKYLPREGVSPSLPHPGRQLQVNFWGCF